MKFLCEECKAKYQIADEKVAGKTVRMKCRKCGHLIEVRPVADATAASAPAAAGGQAAAAPAPGPQSAARTRSSSPPAKPASTPPAKPPSPSAKPPARPAAPRAASGAGAASPRPAAKPAAEQGRGALAGAFKASLEREEEISAPFDMSDISASDEWYVAINGVPVGPIRIAEVRRKAALGAVTEDSLCWQEGLDEWRAVRTFPELAAIVREAMAAGRSSLLPGGAGPASTQPGVRPAPPRSAPPGPAPRSARPAASASAPPARSNVVPITSRLATAEKLEEPSSDETVARAEPPVSRPPAPVIAAVAMDPFAPVPTAPLGLAGVTAPAMRAPAPSFAPPAKKQPPWMAIAMIASAAAFGITAAIVVFTRPPPAPAPAPTVIVQAPAAPVPAPAGTVAAAAAADSARAAPSATIAAKGPVAMAGRARSAPAAATPGHGPLDLGGLTGAIAPAADPGSDAPRAAGQCFSSAQVQQVIGMHQTAIRRGCWERNPTSKPAVNVGISLTIGPDGSPQGVSASSDEPSVGRCVENDVRGWHFPAMGCSQATSFSLHFVRQ